jgi:hypothetical protein
MGETRPSTEDLYSFVDEFVEAVQAVFPKCCIHFEDWTRYPTETLHVPFMAFDPWVGSSQATAGAQRPEDGRYKQCNG